MRPSSASTPGASLRRRVRRRPVPVPGRLRPGREDARGARPAWRRALRPGGRVAVTAFSAYFQLRWLEDGDTFDADQGVNHERTVVQGSRAAPRPSSTCGPPASLPGSCGCWPRAAGPGVLAVWSVTPGPTGRPPEHRHARVPARRGEARRYTARVSADRRRDSLLLPSSILKAAPTSCSTAPARADGEADHAEDDPSRADPHEWVTPSPPSRRRSCASSAPGTSWASAVVSSTIRPPAG